MKKKITNNCYYTMQKRNTKINVIWRLSFLKKENHLNFLFYEILNTKKKQNLKKYSL